MSVLNEIREVSSAVLTYAPYRAMGERVLQANNHPHLRPYQLCGGTASEDMATSLAAAINAIPVLLDAVQAVLDVHEPIWLDGGQVCDNCALSYPCPTVRAVTAALREQGEQA